MIGPEIMTRANAGDVVAFGLINSSIGGAIGGMALKEISDDDPKMISELGYQRWNKFYPAGGCFQQLDHYK